jgi:hypothetical protein
VYVVARWEERQFGAVLKLKDEGRAADEKGPMQSLLMQSTAPIFRLRFA